MMTAMVSPIARPMPRMTAATMPERAALRTTMCVVCQSVAAAQSSLRGRLRIVKQEQKLSMGFVGQKYTLGFLMQIFSPFTKAC